MMYIIISHFLTHRGRFGLVQKCRNKKTGQKFAVKYLKLLEDSKREVAILEKVAMDVCVNIIQLFDAIATISNIIIVMEL